MADFWGQFQPVTLQAPPPQPAMDQLSFTQQYRAQHPKATPAQVQAAWQDYARSVPPLPPIAPVVTRPPQPGTIGGAAIGPQLKTGGGGTQQGAISTGGAPSGGPIGTQVPVTPATTPQPATGSLGRASAPDVQGGNAGDLGGASYGPGTILPWPGGDGGIVSANPNDPSQIIRHTTSAPGGGGLNEQGPYTNPATGGAAIGGQPDTILPATTQNTSSGGGGSNTAPPTNTTTTTTSGGGLTFAQRNDPTFVRQKVTAALTRKNGGQPPSEADIQASMNYVLKADTYSDGKVHSGWSDYWDDRLGNPNASGGSGADNGGADTLVNGGGNGAGGGGGNGNSNVGPYGGVTNASGGLPPGYTIGDLTGGGKYPLSSFDAPGINKPWTTAFTAPDLNDTNDPGYTARAKMGTDAILRNKAAEGTLRTGGALKDLTQFGQDYASNEYDKVYGRALGEYNNAYGIYTNNQSNVYNRLGDYAKMGLTASGGGDTSGLSNAIGNNANNAADLVTNQGNADATKGVVTNNSWRDILKGIVSNI